MFGPNDTTPEFVYHTQVYAAPLYPRFPSTMPNSHTIYTTVRGPNVSTTYIYKSLGNSWSLQSKLVSYNETTGQGAGSGAGYVRPHITNFTNPVQWAGTLFHQVSLDGENVLESITFTDLSSCGNFSCMSIVYAFIP